MDAASGPGRFALAARFPIVQGFYSAPLSQLDALTPAFTDANGDRHYTKTQIGKDLLHLQKNSLTVYQTDYEDGVADYIQRSYIWQTTEFSLQDSPQGQALDFVVTHDGHRIIKNLVVTPTIVADPSRQCSHKISID